MNKAASVCMVLVWAWCFGTAVAAPRIRASIRPNTGITDTTSIRFVVTVEGADGEVRIGSLPKMTNLDRLNGPARAQNFEWINGVSRSTYSFTWSLAPKGPGEAVIPPLTIQVNGTEYRTEPVRFQVKKGTGTDGDSRKKRGDVDGEYPIRLVNSLAKNQVYIGEPVLMTLTLYTRVQIGNLQWIDQPSLPAFWAEQVSSGTDDGRQVAELDGEQYYAYTLDQRFLVPASQGEQTIDPFSLQLAVQTRSNDFFGDFFGRSSGRDVIRRSEPLRLKVLPLPEEGRPESFSGAVGEFLMTAELDRTRAAVDDVVALRVTVEGEGFLKSAQPPKLKLPDGLKAHEPNSEESLSTANGRMISRKTWEWLLVPSSTGEIPIPDIRFGWFDPRTGRYKEKVEGGLVLTVERGRGERSVESGGGLEAASRSIDYIKPIQGRLSLTSSRVHRQGWFLLLAVLPALVLPGWILLGRLRARRAGDLARIRAEKAWPKAKKGLSAIRRKTSGEEAHERIGRTILEYIADHFDRSAAGLTYDEVERLLESRNVKPELVGEVRRFLESCDFVQFVPGEGGRKNFDEPITEAREFLKRLEKVL